MSRVYHFPFRSYCPEKCISCAGLGQKSVRNRSLSDLNLSLEKAISGGYKYLLLPCNAIFSGDVDDFVRRVFEQGLTPLVQINIKSYSADWEPKFLRWGPVRLQLVLEEWNEFSLKKIEQFFSLAGERDLLVSVSTNLQLDLMLQQLPKSLHEKTHYYFPLKLNKEQKNYLDNDEIIELLKSLKPLAQLKPLYGLDTHDPRIHETSNLEPNIAADIIGETVHNDQTLKYSVVIPSYNNAAYVKNTVRHLAAQTMSKSEFEVIVVDDGSVDNTREKLIELQKTLSEPIQLKYIFFPRPQERQMGDGQFRAGIARNLGVKSARGEYLCFLDSDIITPPNFLETLYEYHKEYDAIQTKRIYLTEAASSEETSYSQINEARDVFVPEGGYWQKFYDDPTPWNDRKGNWKYACTYNFSLKRQKFIELGWFRKNYHFYGFEDTDLGLRVVRSGGKLLLADLRVYHLFHANDKSEFKNSDYLRQMVLRKTAKIFFHNSLDLEIHEQLGGLLTEKTVFGALRSTLARILKPRPIDLAIRWAKNQNVRSVNL
jgi:glycosyltransferase involved in cell wall biosynthesis